MVNDGYWLYKVIKLNDKYPIWGDDNNLLGETDINDIAIITVADSQDKEGYYETVILSGKFYGYNGLALNKSDIKKVTRLETFDMLRTEITA